MIDEDQTLEQIKKKVSKHRLYYGKVKPENKIKAEKVKPVDQKPKEKKLSEDKIIEEYEFKQKFVLNLSDPEYIKYLGEPTLVLGKQNDPDDTDWIYNCSTYGTTLEDLGKKGPTIIDLEAIMDMFTNDLYGMKDLDDDEEIEQFYTKVKADDPKQPNMLEINPNPTYVYEDFCNWFHMEDDLEAEEAFEVDEERTWTIGGTLAPCGGFRTFAPKMVISWGKKTYIPMKNGNLKEDTGEPSKLRFRTLEEFGQLKNTEFYNLLEQEIDPEFKLFTKQRHDRFKGRIYNANGIHNSEMGWRGIMNKKVYDKIRKTYLAEQSLYPFNNPTMEGIMDGTNRLGNNKYKDLPKIIEPYYKANPKNTDVAWLKYIEDEGIDKYVNPALGMIEYSEEEEEEEEEPTPKPKNIDIDFHHWLFKMRGIINPDGDVFLGEFYVGTTTSKNIVLYEDDIMWNKHFRFHSQKDSVPEEYDRFIVETNISKYKLRTEKEIKEIEDKLLKDWQWVIETKHGVVMDNRIIKKGIVPGNYMVDGWNQDPRSGPTHLEKVNRAPQIRWLGEGVIEIENGKYVEKFYSSYVGKPGQNQEKEFDVAKIVNNIYPFFSWEGEDPIKEKRNVFNLNAFLKKIDFDDVDYHLDRKLWEKYGKYFHKPGEHDPKDQFFLNYLNQKGNKIYNHTQLIGKNMEGLKEKNGYFLQIEEFDKNTRPISNIPPGVRRVIEEGGNHPYMKNWKHRKPDEESYITLGYGALGERVKKNDWSPIINESRFIKESKTTFDSEGQYGMYPYWFLPKFLLGKPTLKEVIS